ncbi:GPN-loop GTPase 3 [Armadillidium nasatum]|uniref:GPN-loop GTPase 3 n=1 Tax=Armadillidium nasatum TaxID=96803 RepID=A0A5N5TE45_9CRUS|nr:GPN-loop GTPase 3 [Armadillidium nasatum]
MRFAQLVVGPAGSGKSTYCATLQTHGEDCKRVINVINLDPAAEQFQYKALADMRDLVQVSDVMEAEDLNYGPNGGLVFCMEYLMEVEGIEWLQEQLGDEDDDYILFDCPGQIELYTHMDIMKRFAKQLEEWNFRVCVVFILDSHYMVDGAKFLSGSLTALSTMVKLELPQINVLSKMDLLSKQAKQNLEMYLEPEVHELLASEHSISRFNKKYHKLTAALGQVLDEYSLVKFIPLNINKLESISDLLLQIDFSIQYGEDLDIKTTDFEYPDPEEENENNYVPMN